MSNHVTRGQRLGRGIVIEPELRVKMGTTTRRGARLLCDCGIVYEAAISSLFPRGRQQHGDIRSCGCLQTETRAHNGRQNTRHGLWQHPLYRSWGAMMRRCYCPSDRKYSRYGGRGIEVYADWHDVRQFVAWIEANLGLRPVGRSLDRINNDGNYEPGNLRWATHEQQMANRGFEYAQRFLVWVRENYPEVVKEFTELDKDS